MAAEIVVKHAIGGGFQSFQSESATKSEKTYLACPVMTETTNNAGLTIPFEETSHHPR